MTADTSSPVAATRPESEAEAMLIERDRPVVKSAAAGAVSTGAAAAGALAIGALAVGALAIGALAIGRLAIGRVRARDVYIDRLRIGSLEIDEENRAE